jgi:hypothetical protein
VLELGRSISLLIDHTTRNLVLTKISTGYSFGSSTLWSLTGITGAKATLLPDVSGDSRADLVAVNDTTTNVMTSNGSSLNGSSQWSSGAFYGTAATVAA